MIQLNLDDIESVLDRANDDVDRVSVYEYRESLNAVYQMAMRILSGKMDAEQKLDEARAEVSRREREHEALVESAQKALANVAAERDEARAEVERLRAALAQAQRADE